MGTAGGHREGGIDGEAEGEVSQALLGSRPITVLLVHGGKSDKAPPPVAPVPQDREAQVRGQEGDQRVNVETECP